ncbi:Papain-like cysteine peptidase superfamily [Sesbania bispinosa]|nr:Papain-like cysteine peptidase superfamily [Sesbania bispinosa]
MANNNSDMNTSHLTYGEVNGNGDESKSKDGVDEVLCSVVPANPPPTDQLLSMLIEMMSDLKTLKTGQQKLEENIEQLLTKVVENNDNPTKVELNGVNGDENTGHGPTKVDWDNIKVEPFASNDDGDYFEDVSEEEYYYHDMGSKKTKLKVRKHSSVPRQITGTSFLKRESDLYYGKDKGNDLQVHATNFMQGNNHLGNKSNNSGSSQVEDDVLMMPRKISFSPPHRYKKQKIITIEHPPKSTPRRNDGKNQSISIGNTPNGKNVLVPTRNHSDVPKHYIKTKFMPSADMKLTPPEIHLSLYIFQVGGDPSEPIIMMRNTMVSRKKMETLCPNKSVDREMIFLLAKKITLDEGHAATTWCLPPKFVWDVNKDVAVEKLLANYSKDWMPISNSLKYIYVPIEESNGQWHLMVLSMDEESIYHFDSYCEPEALAAKHKTLKKVTSVISEMVHCRPYPPQFFSQYHEMEVWDIIQPDQVPQSPNG